MQKIFFSDGTSVVISEYLGHVLEVLMKDSSQPQMSEKMLRYFQFFS